MNFAELKNAILILKKEERLELLNWLWENFDENGSPISSPETGSSNNRPVLSS